MGNWNHSISTSLLRRRVRQPIGRQPITSFPPARFLKGLFVLEATMKLTDIDPLMIARPTVEVVDNDLNQAYLLSQLIWAIKEFRDSNIEWHNFDAEDFANQIGMPYDWLCSQAQDLAKYVFFGWRTWNRPRPIIQFNLHLFYQTLKESK
jgi:hypothetical protein